MNWLDIVILILIVVPVLIGLKTGIVKAAFTVAGIIIGVILAGRFSDRLGEAMTFISNPSWAKVAAFAIILIVVMIAAAIAAKFVKNVLSAVMLNWINRLGGAVLGFILGAIFCGAILTMWVRFMSEPGDTVSNSVLSRFLLDGFPFVLALLPSEFDSVKNFFAG